MPLHLLAVSSTSLSTRRPSAWFVFDDIKVHRKRVCLAVAALASLHFPKRGAGKAVVAPASLQSQCGDLDGECRLRNDLCKDKAQGTDFSLFCRNILQMESKKLAGHAYFKYYACDEQSLKHHGEKHDKAFSLRGELGHDLTVFSVWFSHRRNVCIISMGRIVCVMKCVNRKKKMESLRNAI